MDKHCEACGRPIENTKKLNQNPNLKYCSKQCRSKKWEKKDLAMDNQISLILAQYEGTNICPSLITKKLFGDQWRQEHQRVIMSCRRLFLKGKIVILQKNKMIANLNFKGPIRITPSS